jgi:hypothetical protein
LNVVCKSITVEETSTSIRPLAAKFWGSIFLLLKVILVFGALFCDVFHSLSLFRIKVMNTESITRHTAVKKVVDFANIKFQRKVMQYFFIDSRDCPSGSEKRSGYRNSIIA